MSDNGPAPLLIQVGITAAQKITLIVGAIVLVVSVINGVDVVRIILRTSITMIVCGVLFWLILTMISRGFMISYVARFIQGTNTKSDQDNREIMA